MTSNKNPSKKCPPKFPTKNPRKDPENHQEGKMGGTQLLTVKIHQPSHEFTFGVGISFISFPLVLTPVV
jgi:hypothetical protein